MAEDAGCVQEQSRPKSPRVQLASAGAVTCAVARHAVATAAATARNAAGAMLRRWLCGTRRTAAGAEAPAAAPRSMARRVVWLKIDDRRCVCALTVAHAVPR